MELLLRVLKSFPSLWIIFPSSKKIAVILSLSLHRYTVNEDEIKNSISLLLAVENIISILLFYALPRFKRAKSHKHSFFHFIEYTSNNICYFFLISLNLNHCAYETVELYIILKINVELYNSFQNYFYF